MTVSLNAGAELDDEISALDQQQLEQATQLADAVFDVSTEENAIAAMEARLDDLRYLLDDIHKSHGMSQSFAMEAERLIPGFNGAAPIGYYTKTPTATQLKISLEEINKGIWVGIAAIAAAVIAMIWKFISWLTGSDVNSSQSASSAFKNADKAFDDSLNRTKNATGLREAVEDLDPGNIPIFDENGKPQYAGDRTKLIEEMLKDTPHASAMRELLENPPAIYRDIVTNGPYTQLIEKVAREIPTATQNLVAKIKLLDKKWRTHSGRTDEFDSDDIVEFESLLQPLYFRISGHRTQDEILKSLKEGYQNLYTDRSRKHDKESIEELLKGIEKGYKSRAFGEMWSATEAVVHVCEGSKDVLDAISLHNHQDDAVYRSGEKYDKIDKIIKRAVQETLKEITVLLQISAELQRYRTELQRFEIAVQKSLAAFIDRMSTQKVEGVEPLARLREIEKLRHALEEAGRKPKTNYPTLRPINR